MIEMETISIDVPKDHTYIKGEEERATKSVERNND